MISSSLTEISDLKLDNKTILIREDYNVPIKNGEIVDQSRIIASLPSIQEILRAGNVK